MPLTKQLIDEINRANAQSAQAGRSVVRGPGKSTGPTSFAGKQRSRMNAVKHNLSGQNLILLDTEAEAYNRMATAMLTDLNPKSEPERQIAQKLIDTNFRLNRLTAIENNMFSFGLAENETDSPTDDRIEIMAAQTRAWIERAHSFDILGRYESRLSRQLLRYQEEFERLQTERRRQETADKWRSPEQIEEHKFKPASFGRAASELFKGPDSWRILSLLPPPKDLQAYGAGDLDTGQSRMAGPGSQNPENNMAA